MKVLVCARNFSTKAMFSVTFRLLASFVTLNGVACHGINNCLSASGSFSFY